MEINDADPIWGEMPTTTRQLDDGHRLVESWRCGGSFLIGDMARELVRRLPAAEKTKLTSWILEKNRFSGEHPPVVDRAAIDKIKALKPLSTLRRIDRLIDYMAWKDYRPGQRLAGIYGSELMTSEAQQALREALAWTESPNPAELYGLVEMLIAEDLLVQNLEGVKIASKGYARMEELQRSRAEGDQVFIAMWFGSSMKEVYADGIVPAVTKAGFHPLRIDQKEHVNKIDDEIIAEIKRSRFVVADFTSGEVSTGEGPILVPRGGVYYEAGYAMGLGIPVIWSVREDQVGKVHFDTRQFNHITWSDAADLQIKLYNRIRAIF